MQQVLRRQWNESLGQLVGDAFAPEQARLGPLECSVCVGEALTGQLPQGRLRRIATWLDDGELGRFAVLVNANDIAASGAEPRWLLTTVLLPAGTTPSQALSLLGELAEDPRRGRVHARHPLQVEHAP